MGLAINWSKIWKPNESIHQSTFTTLSIGWAVLAIFVWLTASSPILPSPWEVIASIPQLWSQEGLGHELWVSLMLDFQAVGLMTSALSTNPASMQMQDGMIHEATLKGRPFSQLKE